MKDCRNARKWPWQVVPTWQVVPCTCLQNCNARTGQPKHSEAQYHSNNPRFQGWESPMVTSHDLLMPFGHTGPCKLLHVGHTGWLKSIKMLKTRDKFGRVPLLLCWVWTHCTFAKHNLASNTMGLIVNPKPLSPGPSVWNWITKEKVHPSGKWTCMRSNGPPCHTKTQAQRLP